MVDVTSSDNVPENVRPICRAVIQGRTAAMVPYVLQSLMDVAANNTAAVDKCRCRIDVSIRPHGDGLPARIAQIITACRTGKYLGPQDLDIVDLYTFFSA